MGAATTVLLAIQVLTFIGLGVIFMTNGHMRLGIAQILLALVQAVIYSEGITR